MKASTKDYVALSTEQEETEEKEVNVEIVEEIVIDTGSSDEEYSTQTASEARRDQDGDHKLKAGQLMSK